MAKAVNMPQIGQDINKGVIREWYVGEGDQGVEFADYMTFGLACDHRVIDGVYGARFLALLAEKLENLTI